MRIETKNDKTCDFWFWVRVPGGALKLLKIGALLEFGSKAVARTLFFWVSLAVFLALVTGFWLACFCQSFFLGADPWGMVIALGVSFVGGFSAAAIVWGAGKGDQ